MIRLGKVMLAHLQKYTHTHKGKAWIGWRAYPLSLSPTNSLSCVPSHEHSMHQNLPSSEHGSTIIGEFHYRGKNYPSCLLVTSIQGILKAKQLFHLGLTKSVCPSLSKELSRLDNVPAAWPSLNYLTTGHIILHVFIDLIPSCSNASSPTVFEAVWQTPLP